LILGLITARGGSKGVPKKNIKIVAGKHLIVWTIEAALKSSMLNRVVLSTDDKIIAEIGKNNNAEVPFLRPEILAQDNSPHIDVIFNAINWLIDNENWCPDYILLLQPTSPLRTCQDIDNVISMGIEKNADSVVSVCMSQVHPYKMKIINRAGKMIDYTEKPKGYLPRQKLPDIYFENGALYLIKTKVLLEQKTLFPENTIPYVMSEQNSLDIDTEWDVEIADLILTNKSSAYKSK
jgi:CMP-N,N'-diacetyllegionaminic acid synthase